jgi:shikimate kinase
MRKTIKQLFDERGEDGFRVIERNMLHEVAEFENVVVSCGGGTPCFFDNMEYLNQQSDTVYLKCEPDVLYMHLQMGKTIRPLLLNKTPEEVHEFIKKTDNAARTVL